VNMVSKNRKRNVWLRALALLLAVFCLTVLASGLLLKRGIKFDKFTINVAMVSDFSLQWRDKLELEIGTITVDEQLESRSSKDFSFIGKSVQAIDFLRNFFSGITIKSIRAGDFTATLQLVSGTRKGSSYFNLTSSDLQLKSNLAFEQNSLVVDIKELSSKRFNSRAEGRILLSGGGKPITGTLAADLASVLPVVLDFTIDSEQLSFNGKEAGAIKDITPFVDLFGLDNNIQRWITEYLKGSRYNLKTFRGVIPWQNPGAILESLYAEVRVDDFEYVFAPGDPGLDPVIADHTDVIFSKGILTITPREATFYGQNVDDGMVKIDFNQLADIILTANIKTLARANDDILTLLDYYKIALPFKQLKGKTKTDFTLVINLNKKQVNTRGIFLIDESEITFAGKNYGVKDARIVQENSKVSIDTVVTFGEMFTGGINGAIEAKSGIGDLDITLERVSFNVGELQVSLDDSGPHPVVKYHIDPEGDMLAVGPSSWHMDSVQLTLGSFSAPFSPKNLSIDLPPTLLTFSSSITAKISGSLLFKEKKFDLQSDLLKYQFNDIVLEQASLPIFIKYDKDLTITTEKTSDWKVNNILTTLYPSQFIYGDNILTMTNGRISYGEFFDSQISGHYDKLQKKGVFFLNDLHIKQKDIGDLFGSSKGIHIEVSSKASGLVINAPELDLSISTSEKKGWSAIIHDLATLHERSALLQQYSLESGSLTVASPDGKQPYSFTADIPYRYAFLVKDDEPESHLHIAGEITSNGLHATVNEKIHIHYSDQLTITSQDVDLNVPAIVTFFKKRSKSTTVEKEEKKALKFTFDTTNSSFFFRPGAKILADKLHIDNVDDKIVMRLEHGSGNIVFDLEGGVFTLEGKKLDGVFMSALVENAQFEKGYMSVAAKGTFDKFSALFKIEDSVVKKFKALQNILAFVNTIPALITFSLPEYDRRGLPLSSAVIGIVMEGGVATVESLEIKSPEINIAGRGWIDFPQNRIDMDFNLITQAGTNIKKIPLAGFILAGGEKKPSATVKVSGDLHDPKVENSYLQETVTLPFAILLRTLALPLHLVKSMNEDSEDGKQ